MIRVWRPSGCRKSVSICVVFPNLKSDAGLMLKEGRDKAARGTKEWEVNKVTRGDAERTAARVTCQEINVNALHDIFPCSFWESFGGFSPGASSPVMGFLSNKKQVSSVPTSRNSEIIIHKDGCGIPLPHTLSAFLVGGA